MLIFGSKQVLKILFCNFCKVGIHEKNSVIVKKKGRIMVSRLKCLHCNQGIVSPYLYYSKCIKGNNYIGMPFFIIDKSKLGHPMVF